MTQGMYRILGGLGSPYSMKMRAVMRYRRIPHVWIQIDDKTAPELASVRPPIIPVIQYPDGSYHNDSTPMIYDLEERHSGRSVIPDDEAMAYLAFLLEDMADEWGTKAMFHYRWFRERDQRQMSDWLAFDRLGGAGLDVIRGHASTFRDRQVGRMAVVGCTAENRPLIEESARRVLASFEAHVTERPYLFGTRPSIADFGWMGQLSQLAVDPTPAEMMREVAPFTFRWLMELDDASGVDGEWDDPQAPASNAVLSLLELAGAIYLPFLVANDAAYQNGDETFRFSALGMDYEQATFRYQVKCLSTLRARFRHLSAGARERIEPVLGEAGCLGVLDTD